GAWTCDGWSTTRFPTTSTRISGARWGSLAAQSDSNDLAGNIHPVELPVIFLGFRAPDPILVRRDEDLDHGRASELREVELDDLGLAIGIHGCDSVRMM